jgi:2-iminobutanoate/2-iminopropanoate deaminase
MKKKVILSENAPAPVGPYSQAIQVGDFLYTAGQIAIDPATGKLIEGDVAAQAEQAIKNIQAVLAAAGATLDNVVKTTVYLKTMSDFAAMNAVYSRLFGDNRPARTTIAIAEVPLGGLFEIEAVIYLPKAGKKKKKNKSSKQ